jgi:hypothetical protein
MKCSQADVIVARRVVDGNAHDNTEWDNNLYLFSQHIFNE